MTKQDRRDMFIVAALTGYITSRFDGLVNTQEDIVKASIIIADEILKSTDYVYEKSELDEID